MTEAAIERTLDVTGPVMKWTGSKWRLADWIISHMPKHTAYVEPCFGSGAIFFRKPPVPAEVINDLDSRVVNLFRVIRDRQAELIRAVELTPWAREEYDFCRYAIDEGDDIEQARRFLVTAWQSIGRHSTTGTVCNGGWRVSRDPSQSISGVWHTLPTRIAATAQRIRHAQIEHRTAIEVIRYGMAVGSNVLLYVDPPYVLKTRGHTGSARKQYHREMSDEDHLELLEALDQHPGPVLLSGYPSALYDEALADWTKKTTIARDSKNNNRTEVLWLNPVAVLQLKREQRQMVLL